MEHSGNPFPTLSGALSGGLPWNDLQRVPGLPHGTRSLIYWSGAHTLTNPRVPRDADTEVSESPLGSSWNPELRNQVVLQYQVTCVHQSTQQPLWPTPQMSAVPPPITSQTTHTCHQKHTCPFRDRFSGTSALCGLLGRPPFFLSMVTLLHACCLLPSLPALIIPSLEI